MKKELAIKKVSLYCVIVAVISFAVLQWSISKLNPDLRTNVLAQIDFKKPLYCASINDRNVFLVQVDRINTKIISLIFKGSFIQLNNKKEGKFKSFFSFSNAGRLIGAKFSAEFDDQQFEIIENGSENAYVNMTLSKNNELVSKKEYRIQGPLLLIPEYENPDNVSNNLTIYLPEHVFAIPGAGFIKNIYDTLLSKIKFNVVKSNSECEINALDVQSWIDQMMDQSKGQLR